MRTKRIAHCACGARMDIYNRLGRCRKCFLERRRETGQQESINPCVTVTPWLELPDGTWRRFASSDKNLLTGGTYG